VPEAKGICGAIITPGQLPIGALTKRQSFAKGSVNKGAALTDFEGFTVCTEERLT